MLRSLSEVGSADAVVGFYQAAKLGAFFKQSLVEAQAIHQEKLRHGGIVIVHGMMSSQGCPEQGDRLTQTQTQQPRLEGTHLSALSALQNPLLRRTEDTTLVLQGNPPGLEGGEFTNRD